MGIPRRAKRRDANEAVIVKQLRKMGMSVMMSDEVDLIIGCRDVNYLIELKDPEKTLNQDGSYKSTALKDSQKKLLATWKGQYHVCHSLEQILEVINEAT